MNIGKVPESVLKRSIIRQIKNTRDEVIFGASIGGDYAAIELKEDEIYVTATEPLTNCGSNIGMLAVNTAVNNVAVAGAGAVAIMLSALLPEGTEESDIKEIMKQVSDCCKELNVQAVGGHTEITDAVNRAIIDVTAIGKVNKDKIISSKGAKPGDDIVITKWIGTQGTAMIAYDKQEELSERFSASYIDAAKSLVSKVSIVKEADLAASMNANAMHDVSKGGIFGALWEIAESSKTGMEIDLKAVPIKQETIEICEYYGLNPYELISSGSLIVCIPNGHDYVRELSKLGISASVAGKITDGNDRVIINGDEKRFLTRPAVDQIFTMNL